MKPLYEGKTKTVFELEDGTYLLQFKDDATGADGKFDPGSNSVGLTIPGMGKGGLRLSAYFFKILQDAGIKTHYITADMAKATMTVRPAKVYGNGIEVICRYRATGSFVRRYGQYAKEGQLLDSFVEITLKDDDRQDPPITKDALEQLGLLKPGEYDKIKEMTQRIAGIIKETIAKKGLELYDIKLEFGRAQNEVLLIDELSGGNMRVYKEDKIVDPLDLVQLILS